VTERGIKDREGEWEEKGGWEKQRETPDIDSRFGGGVRSPCQRLCLPFIAWSTTWIREIADNFVFCCTGWNIGLL